MTAKVLTVVGARPQFIKAGVVSHAFDKVADVEEAIVHTGQHYDYNMSQSFFDELAIPKPKINLGISGGSHAEMTAAMLVGLEKAMLDEDPDAILLYGDTNSTLAAALAAAKLHIPVVHVEAGARTRSMTNPEEINRICTDHVSSLLLACTEWNLGNLHQEGLGAISKFVGDPMLDAFLQYRGIAGEPRLKDSTSGDEVTLPDEYYYLTCHREENSGSSGALSGIFEAANQLDAPVVYPAHPRVKTQAAALMADGKGTNVLLVEPVGYLESIYLVDHAKQVITDSGGLQREAFFAGVKCTTLLDFEVWPETMVGNRNLLARPDAQSILSAIRSHQTIDSSYAPFGDGSAASRIVEAVAHYLEGK